MMASRLLEMRRVLKPSGSLWLHCDQTAGHYIKIVLDAIFGPNNFRNEIVWCYGGGGVPKGAFARKHDNIFFYSKGENCKFNQQYAPYKKHSPFHSKGEPYREQGKVMEDYWLIDGLGSTSQEKMGYPTQKPERLLEIIVKAGSDEGDVVCDPFAGCGTTLAVAQRLNRKWIGIDITALAINILKHRLGPDAVYQVIGEPKSPEDAARLASEDAWQFQLWALGLDKARPAEGIKKGGDKGIDGKRFFKIGDKTEMIIYSVKSGKIGPRDVRDLKGTVESNGAAIGVLLCMGPLTREMREEAAKGGLYRPGPLSETYPKIQIFTVEELMIGGKSVQWPRYSKDVTMPEVQRKDKEEEPSKNLVDFA
jgi:site-specific DNA-methyltransferase (adenine-specific)